MKLLGDQLGVPGLKAVLTPRAHTRTVELGRTTFRKQVLPIGSINYNGRKLYFTKEYLQALVASHRDRAFDAVPFQIADAENRHNNDPERTRGEVLDLEVADDGLYATVSASDRGAKYIRQHPNFGVSVRIIEGFERGDGRTFPAALQHVLGTWDPKINGMKPWELVLAREHELEVEMARAAEQYAREREQVWHRRAVGYARQNNMDWG